MYALEQFECPRGVPYTSASRNLLASLTPNQFRSNSYFLIPTQISTEMPIEPFYLEFDVNLFLQEITGIGQNKTRDLFYPIIVAACKNKWKSNYKSKGFMTARFCIRTVGMPYSGRLLLPRSTMKIRIVRLHLYQNRRPT